MYRPAAYRENDEAILRSLITANGFAVLVSHSDGQLQATHLPLLIEESTDSALALFGHLARNNPQWRGIADGDEVLAVFSGPHAYISPRWYSAEADVPTWNYEAVHVYGQWQLIEGSADTRAVLEQTTARYESANQQAWRLKELEPRLLDNLQRGVVAFRIVATRIEGARKLGQDKQPVDVRGVVNGLRGRNGPGDAAVAAAMSVANRLPDKPS